MSESDELSAPVASAPTRQVCQGPVMPIGGAEDKSPGSDILERFIELAGGNRGRIAIVPTASEEASGGGRALRQGLPQAGRRGGGLVAG